jgi:hypothetical protein
MSVESSSRPPLRWTGLERPEEVAKAADASYITGIELFVDGAFAQV